MLKLGKKKIILPVLIAVLTAIILTGCGGNNDGKTEITMVQYKQEAVAIFEEL